MKVISHRGNIDGPNPALENSINYILTAIKKGYDVEIDVWYIDDKIYLGHDKPQYAIPLYFLKSNKERLWCHAKNIDALKLMIEEGIHCFWHQGDDVTITSKGYIWTHSDTDYFTDKSVACWIDAKGDQPDNVFGICSDYCSLVR
jgi:hypothetical protein